MTAPAAGALAGLLEDAYERYTRPEHLSADPLGVVVEYDGAADREVVAFVAAGLAFGNVRSILRSARRALAPLGDSPARTLATMSPEDARAAAEGFNHRWVFAEDLANVFVMLGEALRRAGGLEPLFAAGMVADAADVRLGVAALGESLLGYLDPEARARRGTRYFLPSATGAGAAKRLMMMVRWMVRSRDLDLGLWSSARPGQLVVPLDTHVARIGRYIGLTDRRGGGMATALDITRSLRAVDPDDPVRFDFALSHLGILGDCPRQRDPARCARCTLFDACRL